MPTDAELAQPIPSRTGAFAARRVHRRWPLPVLPLRLLLALAFGTLGIVSTLVLALLVHGQATARLEEEVGASSTS